MLQGTYFILVASMPDKYTKAVILIGRCLEFDTFCHIVICLERIGHSFVIL